MAWKWLLSFMRREWDLDYPVHARRNAVDDPSMAWTAQILNWHGPVGLGPTAEAAVEHLRANFAEIVQARRKVGDPMPPGSIADILERIAAYEARSAGGK